MKLANRIRGRRLKAAVLLLAAIAPAGVALGQCEYTIAHTLPNAVQTCGGQPYAPIIQAIADDGAVCGFARAYVSCPERPFIWHPGDAAVTLLPLPPGMVEARAIDLNESDLVVGFARGPNESAYPCQWINGVVSMLPMPKGFIAGFAEAVNSSGSITGYLHTDDASGNRPHAFLWTSGVPVDLHQSLPADFVVSLALDISDTGIVVGWSGTNAPNGQRAMIWQNGIVTILPPITGGTTSEGIAVNNLGDIVGTGLLSPTVGRGFISRDGTLNDLGILQGYQTTQAVGINDSGRIAGWCEISTSNRSYVWQAGTLSTVTVGGLPLSRQLWAINNAGEVVSGRTIYQPVPLPPFDIDQNCAVNINDLLEVINHWGLTSVAADCSQDGIVDVQDLVLVLLNWGQ